MSVLESCQSVNRFIKPYFNITQCRCWNKVFVDFSQIKIICERRIVVFLPDFMMLLQKIAIFIIVARSYFVNKGRIFCV